MSDPAQPAAASRAMAGALTLSDRPWRILGTSTHVWWCAADSDVLVISDDRAAWLPNAVIVPSLALDGRRGEAPGEIMAGAGRLISGPTEWRIVRWWDPRVDPVATDRSDVTRTLRMLPASAPASFDDAFAVALRRRAAGEAITQAKSLIGRGLGLTPEGDDYLVGAVAGFGYVSRAIGDLDAEVVLSAIRDPLLDSAASATTRLSHALLRHAFSREVATPIGALLRSITGRGDLEAAVAATTAIGHRSGPALAAGVAHGAAAACGVSS